MKFDTEATKTFLIKELTPITEADPAVLADYVLVLLQNDTTEEELKKSCYSSLEDFLHDKTSFLVQRLFDFIVKEEEEEEEEEEEDRHPNRHRDKRPFKRRGKCRDFEDKGYCLRGEDCFYEHDERPKKFKRSSAKSKGNSLVVEKIPIDHCSIEKVHDYFKRFGVLNNIQVNAEQRKAIIQFATPEEAQKAYQSPDAIFDNRFVKVYWSKEGQEPIHQPSSSPSWKSYVEFQKQKEHLLSKQIEQQKAILDKLKQESISDTEKHSLITALRKISNVVPSQVQGGAVVAEQKEKERLDRELDMLNFMKQRKRSMKLDNRPTTFSISNFPVDKIALLETTLAGLGVTEKSESDSTITLSFDKRWQAEKAYLAVQKFPDVIGVNIQWITTKHASAPQSEEEEEEDQEKNWKR